MTAVVSPLSTSHMDSPKSRGTMSFTPSHPTSSPKLPPDARSPQSGSLVPPSPYPQHLDPSPTESSGTDGTEIDEEAQDDTPQSATNPGNQQHGASSAPNVPPVMSPISPSNLAKLDTNVTLPVGPTSDDAPTSVIHAPPGFKDLDSGAASPNSLKSPRPNTLIASPSTPDAARGPDDKRLSGQEISQSNDSTDTLTTVTSNSQDSGTKQDKRQSTASARSAASQTTSNVSKDSDLDIQVVDVDGDLTYRDVSTDLGDVSDQLRELQDTLTEMWTLCNRLASLSANHRTRAFSNSSDGELQEAAWNYCWQLCQELYEHRDQPLSNIHKAIELCRQFTQARFEARTKGDPKSDAILRVSFEMCAHLYNVRDRTLPPAFVKRTMDFYVAFCHRMMKQKSALPRNTDELIRACWTLAEALYNLQYPVNDEAVSEEDLVSAVVQACWDLSDLFRSGWSQGKHTANRSTPRAAQTSFSGRSRGMRTASEGRTSSLSNRTYHDAAASFTAHQPPLPPETPITIFDDITEPSSPESTNAPNILVLGPNARTTPRPIRYEQRWSSGGSSSLSESSDVPARSSSQRTSSTATKNEAENHHLRMLRVLLLKAALDVGFSPYPSTSPSSSSEQSPADSSGQESNNQESLQAFVDALPKDSFGSDPAHLQLFDHYQSLVANDPSLRHIGSLLGGRYAAGDIAKAVTWLSDTNSTQWGWMRDLHRRVMGMGSERMDKSLAELEL